MVRRGRVTIGVDFAKFAVEMFLFLEIKNDFLFPK